ncbi:MAG: cytochrome c maturation protein CcmE [Coriobacteriia bacterium]|nr:cytochrome c maturation protein CcmE [Coriobacteriia bacterium]
MNKRARNRLIGVTAIIVIVGAALLLGAGSNDSAYSRTVSDVIGNTELAGERVRVSGTVIDGSWDRKSNPMRFEIRNEGETEGPTIEVLYTGGVPSTFGDGVVAVVTGELNADGTLITSADMITKCPSKYESASGALSIDQLLSQTSDGYKPVTGYIVAGSIAPVTEEIRFKVQSTPSGGGQVPVFFEGALPDGMTDGSQVVLGGELDEDGVYVAVSVSLSDSEQ